MKQSKKSRQKSALERRKEELAFWKKQKPESVEFHKFGKVKVKLMMGYVVPGNVPKETIEAMIKTKIQICEKDIKNLEAKK
jgi:hypothetical protein